MIENYPLYWPEGRQRTTVRQNNPNFKKTLSAARDSLLAELQRLGAKDIIVSTNIPLRLDGLFRADIGNAPDPGVAVYFSYKKRPMCFACDKYFHVRENVRAIALTIEAIRGIERWGSSDMMERAFRGFTAIPERAGEWWRDVFGFAKEQRLSVDDIETAFRRLAHVAHPDKGGNVDQWQQLCIARENARKDLGVTR